jgi:hypothetical protein
MRRSALSHPSKAVLTRSSAVESSNVVDNAAKRYLARHPIFRCATMVNLSGQAPIVLSARYCCVRVRPKGLRVGPPRAYHRARDFRTGDGAASDRDG